MPEAKGDIKPNLKSAAQEFVSLHLVDLCREEIEWRDTGILRDGLMRQLAAICAEHAGDSHDALRLAQHYVTNGALDSVARSQ